jgi:hypothetical protein
MMTKLALGYPNQKLTDVEAEARMELYAEQLADIPYDMLGPAFAAAIRTLKFFPTIAELRDLATAQPAPPRRRRQHRIEMLLAAHGRRPAEAADGPIDEAEMNATNAALQKLGVRTRVARDGSTYQVEPPAPATQIDAAVAVQDSEQAEAA